MITVETNELLTQLQSQLIANEREVEALEGKLRAAWEKREELRRVISAGYGPAAARIPTPLPEPPKPKPAPRRLPDPARRATPKKKGPSPGARWAKLSRSAQRTLMAVASASSATTEGVRTRLEAMGDVQNKQAVLMRLRRLAARGVLTRVDDGPWSIVEELRALAEGELARR